MFVTTALWGTQRSDASTGPWAGTCPELLSPWARGDPPKMRPTPTEGSSFQRKVLLKHENRDIHAAHGGDRRDWGSGPGENLSLCVRTWPPHRPDRPFPARHQKLPRGTHPISPHSGASERPGEDTHLASLLDSG